MGIVDGLAPVGSAPVCCGGGPDVTVSRLPRHGAAGRSSRLAAAAVGGEGQTRRGARPRGSRRRRRGGVATGGGHERRREGARGMRRGRACENVATRGGRQNRESLRANPQPLQPHAAARCQRHGRRHGGDRAGACACPRQAGRRALRAAGVRWRRGREGERGRVAIDRWRRCVRIGAGWQADATGCCAKAGFPGRAADLVAAPRQLRQRAAAIAGWRCRKE
jgi:hypothetical protein